MKILCVDDSVLIRKIVTQSADILGAEVIEAGDGQEALKYVEELDSEIALITLDWHMPKLSGYEFLKRVKATDSLKDIPVLMVTSESSKKNVVKAIKAGVNNYLLKPFTQEDLVIKMQECLGECD